MRARIFVAAALALAAPAQGQAPPERIEFASRTPAGPSDYLAGGGAAVTLHGFLYRPAAARGPVPAMVLAHGSGGILPGRERDWAARLVAAGVAAFVVDSFGPRGIGGTAEDQSRLPLAASIADHFAALGALAGAPGIDPARIGIMGFSKGGQIALYAALEPFRRAGGVGDRRFALHVALYPSCSLPYMAERTTRAPMLFLLGGADDYTPAAHCVRYADYFRGQSAAVSVREFPGAHHGFDLPSPPRFLPRVQTARDCALDIFLEPVRGRRWDGRDVPNEAIAAYIRGCVTRGATVGGNAAALEGAVAEVEAAVAAHLRPAR